MTQKRENGHSGRHHGHRRRHWNRKKRQQMLVCIAVVCLFCILGTVFLYQYRQRQSRFHVEGEGGKNIRDGYRTITWNGKKYQYNNLITTVLYAGVDSTGELKAGAQYSNRERADSISLVVMDKKKGRMTIVGISRDAMTQVRRFTLNGSDMGTYETHLGYAYSYGDGGEASCDNLLEAVQGLFGEIPIHQYVVTNMTTIPYINRLVGGVTVRVPNSDVAQVHPELTEGAVVTLDDTNVYDYLHYRDTSKDFSNEGRIQRQEAYITEYVAQAQKDLQEDPGEVWNGIEEMDRYLQTNITKNKYLNLVNLFLGLDFSESDFRTLPGEDALGELHDEFHVDQDALQQMIVELFYEEV